MSSRKALPAVSICILAFLHPLLLSASVDEAQLQAEYQNKVLTLRRPFAGDRLRYNAAGHAIEAGEPGVWTVEGQIEVKTISVNGTALHIKGRRVFLFYDPDSKQMRDVATVSKDQAKAKHLRRDVAGWAEKNGKVEIELDCPSAAAMADVKECVQGAFLGPDESIGAIAPRFWRRWLGTDEEADPKVENSSKKGDSEAENRPYKVGGGISPPRATGVPDPVYSSAAKAAHYEATSVLWLVVNASGVPEHVRIQRPAGLGLDEQAVAAVLTWRFSPALKDGKPVRVQINVEVNFRLR